MTWEQEINTPTSSNIGFTETTEAFKKGREKNSNL